MEMFLFFLILGNISKICKGRIKRLRMARRHSELTIEKPCTICSVMYETIPAATQLVAMVIIILL